MTTIIIDDTSEAFNNLTLFDKIEEGEIIEDPDVKEDDQYKFIQRIGDDIVKRNNNDPNLTPDGLLTLDAHIKRIKELDEQTNKERPVGIDNLIKLRCVTMHIIGQSPLTDTRFMKTSIKNQYIRARDTYIIDLTQEKLNDDFNRICHETIFDNGEDISKYPVFL
jgi:hypothetical protein